MAETSIKTTDLSATEELRAFGKRGSNGNGKERSADVELRAIIPGKNRAFGATRQVNPDPNSFSVLNTERRPWGRDVSTLNTLKLIRDLDPQAAHAVWNFLRLVNPGHHLRAISLNALEGQEDEFIDPRGQEVLDDLAMRVGEEYGGGLDQLHNVLALSLITNGAVSIEAAPTEDLAGTEDWYPVDPRLITFKRDPKTKRLIMGQKIQGTFTPLNTEQVFYQPLDPDVDDPYGRPPLLPAIHASMAKAQMLNDLRAVAHNQGYPRLDVTLDWEEIRKAAPPNLLATGSEQDFRNWAAKQLDTVATDYQGLNVDDTFVHFDWIKVSMVGPNYAASSFDFAGFEKILSRSLQSSLKTLPILLGINDNTSETHGSIQWQIQVAAVLTMQRLCKRVIEKSANASLRYAGVNAKAKMEYDEIRAIDRRFEAQSQQLEDKNAAFEVQMGWRDNDEAAKMVVGHPSKAEPIWDPKAGIVGTADEIKAGGGASQAGSPEATSNLEKPASSTYPFTPYVEVTYGNSPSVSRSPDTQDDATTLERYEIAALVYFRQAQDETVRLLEAEGWELRDTARDIAQSVFGLGYARKMKGLLREAVAEGIKAGDYEVDVPERLVDRIWEANRVYVTKIRDELREAIRDGTFRTLDDVKVWFDARAWREEQMGRFLAKQGISGGYAYSRWSANALTRFVWRLGFVESRHCDSCLARDGNDYSYDSLLVQGFPGSDALECGARCHCVLEEI